MLVFTSCTSENFVVDGIPSPSRTNSTFHRHCLYPYVCGHCGSSFPHPLPLLIRACLLSVSEGRSRKAVHSADHTLPTRRLSAGQAPSTRPISAGQAPLTRPFSAGQAPSTRPISASQAPPTPRFSAGKAPSRQTPVCKVPTHQRPLNNLHFCNHCGNHHRHRNHQN